MEMKFASELLIMQGPQRCLRVVVPDRRGEFGDSRVLLGAVVALKFNVAGPQYSMSSGFDHLAEHPSRLDTFQLAMVPQHHETRIAAHSGQEAVPEHEVQHRRFIHDDHVIG